MPFTNGPEDTLNNLWTMEERSFAFRLESGFFPASKSARAYATDALANRFGATCETLIERVISGYYTADSSTCAYAQALRANDPREDS